VFKILLEKQLPARLKILQLALSKKILLDLATNQDQLKWQQCNVATLLLLQKSTRFHDKKTLDS